MVLHLIPVMGLPDEYINWLRLLEPLQDNVFCITTSRSGVIKYKPQLLGIRSAVILPEPHPKDKKRKVFFKTVSELAEKAELIVWHGMLSTNKRFAMELAKNKAISKKSLLVCDVEENRFLKAKPEEFMKLCGKFDRLCFKNPIMKHVFETHDAEDPEFEFSLEGKKVYTMDLVPNGFFFKNSLVDNSEYDYIHTGVNMCIIPPLSVSAEERPEYLESIFDIRLFEEPEGTFIGQISYDELDLNCFIFPHKSNVKYNMLPLMDCLYFPEIKSWNMKYVLHALSRGKHVFIDNEYYLDFLRKRGLKAFSVSEFGSADKSRFTEPLTDNMNCRWLTDCIDNGHIIAQWTELINTAKKDVNGA